MNYFSKLKLQHKGRSPLKIAVTVIILLLLAAIAMVLFIPAVIADFFQILTTESINQVNRFGNKVFAWGMAQKPNYEQQNA